MMSAVDRPRVERWDGGAWRPMTREEIRALIPPGAAVFLAGRYWTREELAP